MSARECADVDIAGLIKTNVTDVIRHTANDAPRSRQSAMGPSEYGHPCARRLAYRLLEWPQTNTDTDPLAAIIGTSVHTWLEQAFTATGETLPDGRPRYIVERRVNVDAGLSGSADLLDRQLNVVIDWKVPGATAMRNYKDNGPSEQYRAQAHGYGLGYLNAGEHVDHVAIVFIPRSGQLRHLHVWTEPLDVALAQHYLDRKAQILELTSVLDVENTPTAWSLFPTADSHCVFCPWFQPGSTDLSKGCPGDSSREARPAQFKGLVS